MAGGSSDSCPGRSRADAAFVTFDVSEHPEHAGVGVVDQQYDDPERFASEPWAVTGMRRTLCGLRRPEVLGLDWQRVDLDVGSVEIAASRVKTGRGHTTEIGNVKVENSRRLVRAEILHAGAAAALRRLCAQCGPLCSPVVLTGEIRSALSKVGADGVPSD